MKQVLLIAALSTLLLSACDSNSQASSQTVVDEFFGENASIQSSSPGDF